MTDSLTLERFEKQHLSKILWPSSFKQKFIQRFGILGILETLPKDSTICDFGSGTGRLTSYLVDKEFNVTNFEPTKAGYLVSKRVTKSEFDQITLVNDSKDLSENYFDLVVSIGVIHHLRDPINSLNEMIRISKFNSGQIVFWVYAKQGKVLQFFIELVRKCTSRIPHVMNLILSTFLSILFFSCFKILKKSKGKLFKKIGDYGFRDLNLMIYDQMQPPYSKYFLESELASLMSNANIENYKIVKSGFGFTVIFNKN